MGILGLPQWELFARELVELELSFLTGGTEAQRGQLRHKAYQKAGFTGNMHNARRLANKPEVKARVAELFKEAMEFRDVNVVKVVNRIDRVGRANLADFFEVVEQQVGEGETKTTIRKLRLKEFSELPRDLTEALRKAKLGENGEIEEVELCDKNQANFTLLKYLGGLPEAQPAVASTTNILALLDVSDQRALAEALEAIPAGPASPDREPEKQRSAG